MHTLLTDIEYDMLELKSLLQMLSTNNNPALWRTVGRCIRRMQAGLNELENQLSEFPMTPEETPATDDSIAIPQPVHQATPSILAERIRPAADLRRAFSLNDRFRFMRELFGGDAARMDETMQQISEAASLQEALDRLTSDLRLDESNETVADFVELLKRYFK